MRHQLAAIVFASASRSYAGCYQRGQRHHETGGLRPIKPAERGDPTSAGGRRAQRHRNGWPADRVDPGRRLGGWQRRRRQRCSAGRCTGPRRDELSREPSQRRRFTGRHARKEADIAVTNSRTGTIGTSDVFRKYLAISIYCTATKRPERSQKHLGTTRSGAPRARSGAWAHAGTARALLDAVLPVTGTLSRLGYRAFHRATGRKRRCPRDAACRSVRQRSHAHGRATRTISFRADREDPRHTAA